MMPSFLCADHPRALPGRFRVADAANSDTGAGARPMPVPASPGMLLSG